MAYVRRSTMIIDLADGHTGAHQVALETAIAAAADSLRKITGVTVSTTPLVTVSERAKKG